MFNFVIPYFGLAKVFNGSYEEVVCTNAASTLPPSCHFLTVPPVADCPFLLKQCAAVIYPALPPIFTLYPIEQVPPGTEIPCPALIWFASFSNFCPFSNLIIFVLSTSFLNFVASDCFVISLSTLFAFALLS